MSEGRCVTAAALHRRAPSPRYATALHRRTPLPGASFFIIGHPGSETGRKAPGGGGDAFLRFKSSSSVHYGLGMACISP